MSNIISVGQFNKYIHDILLAEEILYNIEIYGEVSGIKLTNGVIYFSIKDSDAVLNCVKFGVKETDYLPKEGESVLVRGTPNYYIKGGRFSFNVNKISPYGVGILYQRFLELKAKLERLGLFDEKKKKPLPKTIKRIGVVTSETGAVIHDIIDISHRRNPTLDIIIYPAKVQGVGAEETIIAGIKAFQETDIDVIIIARGGGSIEDLSCFNEEKLALAIASSAKPIISAVGHETDFTIADFVADLRAPTPSAAAELVSVDLLGLKTKLQSCLSSLLRLASTTYDASTKDINNLVYKLFTNVTSLYRDKYQRLVLLCNNLQHSCTAILNSKTKMLEILSQKLDGSNPDKILKMGYAMLLTKDNKLVKSCGEVNIGDKIKAKITDGMLVCELNKKETANDGNNF